MLPPSFSSPFLLSPSFIFSFSSNFFYNSLIFLHFFSLHLSFSSSTFPMKKQNSHSLISFSFLPLIPFLYFLYFLYSSFAFSTSFCHLPLIRYYPVLTLLQNRCKEIHRFPRPLLPLYLLHSLHLPLSIFLLSLPNLSPARRSYPFFSPFFHCSYLHSHSHSLITNFLHSTFIHTILSHYWLSSNN